MSGLPGRRHALPEGATCECHPDRPAVANVQGETDSFGFETILMCQECLDADREYERSEEARTGTCDWCKREATDLAWARDYDEGMHGPVYRACKGCRERVEAEARREMDERHLNCPEDDYEDDDDPREECGRWDQQAGGLARDCRLAGTEDCELCPYHGRAA